jgi:Mn-dependent DtxR family transcriptional regulator
MDYEILGFIKASKNRLRVLEMLCSGIASKREIAHKLRIAEPLVSRTIEELLGRDLVETTGGKKEGYRATEKGKKAFRASSRQ